MSPELNNSLYERYPLIFAEHSLAKTQTSMCWGIGCGDGWYVLLDALCAGLQNETDSGNAPQVVATQIKTKFGGLRFYVNEASARQMGMIELAGSLSQRTCEICGAPGNPNRTGWIRTRCASHKVMELSAQEHQSKMHI